MEDDFIHLPFQIETLIPYFDDDAWMAVKKLVDLKVSISTCAIWKQLCFEVCIECTKFNQWCPFICAEINLNNFNLNLTATWLMHLLKILSVFYFKIIFQKILVITHILISF